MKIVSLVGARPQFIKEAVLHKQCKEQGIEEILVNSGQHYDVKMSDVFFQTLDIAAPDRNLDVHGGNHGEMTGRIMIAFEKAMLEIQPAMIVVFGDTNTTLAGALVGAKLKIPVAHVEAGIRMNPKDMPEEINRVLVDRISTLLFCPTQQAVENLKREGITEGVHFVGDIMYDLYKMMEGQFRDDTFQSLQLTEGSFVLVTLHRDYNVDTKEKLEPILQQLQEVSKQGMPIVFPLHPRTKKRIEEFGLKSYLDGMAIIEPLDYLNLMGLVQKSAYVITDSGGLQKETYFAGKRSLVVMPETGWVELVDNGWNVLCDGTNLAERAQAITKEVDAAMGIYGDGTTGKKIVTILLSEQ